MKDPPLTRNGPANFIQPAQQQGAVMMVYGLDSSTANTDKLFNLFCLYGNVVRNDHHVNHTHHPGDMKALAKAN
ncbi:hypothetical protein pipiens_000428, partial [Culex pipiens pipiens]